MKEHIKREYYIAQTKRIMKKLYQTTHSKAVVERMIKDEPVLVREIIMELLNEKQYFNEKI